MTTKLGLYNGALLEIGAQSLASTSENRPTRYYLDDAYDNVTAECLEAGPWDFALRAVEMTADDTVVPDFGWQYAFAKPTDWVRTSMVSGSETFDPPLLEYAEENEVIYANVATLYLQYVSDDTDYGMDLTKWPRSFARFVEVALAERIVNRATQNSADKERLERLSLPNAKKAALNKDALRDPPKFPPMSSWNASRRTGSALNGTKRGLP